MTDWAVIEQDYRAGIKPVRLIGSENRVSHTAINKRAKRDGWTRDLKAKIKAKAEELVSKAVVSNEVSKKQMETEKGVIEANANVLAAAINRHRAGLVKAWAVVDMLLSEIKHQTEHIELYDELGEMMASPDEKGVDKLNEIYRKAMSLPSRASTAKTLMDAIKTAITLEREVLGIADAPSENPLAELIKRMGSNSFKPVEMEGECKLVEDDSQVISLEPVLEGVLPARSGSKWVRKLL